MPDLWILFDLSADVRRLSLLLCPYLRFFSSVFICVICGFLSIYPQMAQMFADNYDFYFFFMLAKSDVALKLREV